MPRGVGLSRERVVEAAAALVDAHGPAALTLARLADALGVRSPSLFNHVQSLDDLRDAVAASAWPDLEASLTDTTSLPALAHAWRGFGLRRPGVWALAAKARPGDPVADAVTARLLTAVAHHTGPGEPAVHAARALRALVHGFVQLESDGGFALPVDLDASFDHAVNALVRGLLAASPVTAPLSSDVTER
jgi:AcrR family transcriptional regulator